MSGDLDALAARTGRGVLGDAEREAALAALGGRWTIVAHAPVDELTLTLPAQGMTKTGQIAAHAGALADEMDHHPRIVIEYPRLTLALNTHDKGAITTIDYAYAARLEQWLRANPDLL